MIEYHYETNFELNNETKFTDWISRIIRRENKSPQDIAYVFCDDAYLLEINQRYLQHDTFTDIISFDYGEGDAISGDIFISIERLRENAVLYKDGFDRELKRVMAHGILHFLGYKDKKEKDAALMRAKENEMIQLFHVEQ